MKNYDKYLEIYFVENGVEYEGFVRNTHPSKKLYIKCWIDNQYEGYIRLHEVEPQSNELIMFHNCGPMAPWDNQFDFKIVEISDKPFEENKSHKKIKP